ncbi:hypothetical protein H8B02_41610 [Bradyrhizobium sp. Pear77]|uniref:hypothetical protein n=1 Tax=Bradyrhizobium altum TaxID=1571202 RepID=UPI001E50BC4A|nr:hypothetical protein [Bradyrhizobium altum]MCC8959672.1 hypothetical protein [Bradyrhizobium altum]
MWDTVTALHSELWKTPAKSAEVFLCLIMIIYISSSVRSVASNLREMDRRLARMEKLIKTLTDSV